LDKVAKFRSLVAPAKGLIFDFDGFLADSEKFHFLSYKETFARHGHDVDETEYYKYWTSLGHGARGEIERHGLDLEPQAIRDEKKPIFAGYCEDGSIELFPQAHRIIDLAMQTRKRLAIASGTSAPNIRAILRNAGRADVFDIIVGYDRVPEIKPAPKVFLVTLEEMGLAPADCVVFEDAEKGVAAANAAGIPVIVVLTRETKDFAFDGADLILDSHDELVEVMEAALG